MTVLTAAVAAAAEAQGACAGSAAAAIPPGVDDARAHGSHSGSGEGGCSAVGTDALPYLCRYHYDHVNMTLSAADS